MSLRRFLGCSRKSRSKAKAEWSELPLELLTKIGKSLENRIDVFRFRSVCESWRSSIPPTHPNSPSFPLQIPQPINSSIDAYLNQATLYRIEPQSSDESSNLEPLSPSSSKGWLIKVEESKDLPLRLLNPISDRKIKYSLNTSPKLWNSLDYRVSEICRSYTIQSLRLFSGSVNKVVFFPSSSWSDVEDSVACCVHSEGKLVFMKHGDDKWTLLDDKNFYYDDVIVHKGQFYVTDRWGTISWVDILSLKLIQFSPPLCGFGNKKHLVESCESLYVVDRYNESEQQPRRRNYVGLPERDAAAANFKVYKLDEEWGTWVDVKNLEDRVFILSNSCSFSVSAKEVKGYQGNCIYFADMFDIRVYNLEDNSITTIDFDPCCESSVWPSPSWLRTEGISPVSHHLSL